MSIDYRGSWIDTHPQLTPADERRAMAAMAVAAIHTGHIDELPTVLAALGLIDTPEAMQPCGHPVSAITRDTSGQHKRCAECKPSRRALPLAASPCAAPTPASAAGARWHWRRSESCPVCSAAAARVQAERVAQRVVAS